MKVVLLDMDGTITKHRSKIESSMVRKLKDVLEIATVGIVSGSKFKDVCYQCSELWDIGGAGQYLDRLLLMPCNGTQVYTWSAKGDWQLQKNATLENEIGRDNYQKLLRQLIRCQLEIIADPDHLRDFPIRIDFLDDRKSLINWCPIGRSSTHKTRSGFIQIDGQTNIRDHMRDMLKAYLIGSGFDISKITIAKGGQTSLDIFPNGWDKTYALKYFQKETPSNVFFVGDACDPGQNDHEIYESLSKFKQGYKTKSPEETIKILDKIIKTIKMEKK
jgi:phosphomannomutase